MNRIRALFVTAWDWVTAGPQNAIILVFNVLWIATYVWAWQYNESHITKYSLQDWRDLYPYMMGKYLVDSLLNSKIGEQVYGGVK